MLELKTDSYLSDEAREEALFPSLHPSFFAVRSRIQKWLDRFFLESDALIFKDLFLLYLLATKKYLDHRTATHVFRLVLSIHFMQKKLLHPTTLFSESRQFRIRWLSTSLVFSFLSKPVLGCLLGFNLTDRYELFDEENVVLALQKYLPQLQLVKESSYCHTSEHKNLKLFYFEVEKRDGSLISLEERILLKNIVETKIKNSIQTLTPNIFMGANEEEVYKNILVLSQEINSMQDLPQAYITLAQHTGKEIVFRVALVYISPFHRFSLRERFFDCLFISERMLPIKFLEDHPVEAHIFRLLLPRDPALLRSDGSLDFYLARQKAVSLITTAIGEFRDFNGGILIKQQQLLHSFKEKFKHLPTYDAEFMEAFFYGLTPLENQVILQPETLFDLFEYFLDQKEKGIASGFFYGLNIYSKDPHTFLVIHAKHSSISEVISALLETALLKTQKIAYNVVDGMEGVFFNCVLLETPKSDIDLLIEGVEHALHNWSQKRKSEQVLKIALENPAVSLDPRLGGGVSSFNVLAFLFEGLTRFNQNGEIENALTESFEVSPDLKQYTFRLKPTFWNDGSPISAYDFEYAWKKILSPDFKTSFASLFYSIKNAREVKEGKLPLSELGIHALDNRTLKVDLEHLSPYFLQLTAHPMFFPVNRLVDQQRPQWPYEAGESYPCNGPFQLRRNEPHQGYQLIKNPFYWDRSQVHLDQIILSLTTPPQAFQAFQKKEVDWIGNPFGGYHSFYTSGQEGRLVSFPNVWVCWLVFNTLCPPFNHLKMRRVLAYLIQRSQITASAFLRLDPAYSVLMPHYRKSQKHIFPDTDVEKARELFEEVLQETKMKREDFPPLELVFNERGMNKYVAGALQEQIKQVLDLDCVLDAFSCENKYFYKVSSGNFQLSLMYWASWIDDPIDTLNSFKFATEGVNFAKWEHPEFRKLLDLSDRESNPFLRSSHLLKAEEVFAQEVPVVPLFYQSYQALVNKDLQTLIPRYFWISKFWKHPYKGGV